MGRQSATGDQWHVTRTLSNKTPFFSPQKGSFGWSSKFDFCVGKRERERDQEDESEKGLFLFSLHSYSFFFFLLLSTCKKPDKNKLETSPPPFHFLLLKINTLSSASSLQFFLKQNVIKMNRLSKTRFRYVLKKATGMFQPKKKWDARVNPSFPSLFPFLLKHYYHSKMSSSSSTPCTFTHLGKMRAEF